MISDWILVIESVFTKLVTPLVTELVTQSPARGARAALLLQNSQYLKLFFHYLVI